ncbi:hypothetical protein QVD17_14797 [Tagetes erecta]|uniref:Uncharacterized protein n=1 Tax=Tagetes erecta TaxID=13708 RepID=A0AAD8KR46_TARER|nr:hypothetical protein QVD17_14797 [Tagetes erecta]
MTPPAWEMKESTDQSPFVEATSARMTIVYYTFCMVRYSDESILGNQETNFNNGTQFNSTIALETDIDQFNTALQSLLDKLTATAVAGTTLQKFATGDTTVPNNLIKLYALVQCVPYLLAGATVS